MKDKHFKAWQVTREKGKLHFFLVAGVLSYGLPMFIVMAFFSKPFATGFTSTAALIHYMIWPTSGLLFGVIMWYISEHNYLKELAKRSDNA